MKKISNEEFKKRLDQTGLDVYTDDVYVNMKTKMSFYCSKGHRWDSVPGPIIDRKCGCPCCSGARPIIGETDLWTTRPDIAKFLANHNDGYELKEFSNKKVEFKCPNCGEKIVKEVSKCSKYGFHCPKCSDGISYPNKFIYNMLDQLRIEYITEYKINGLKRYYDVYIPQYNLIIEMHGAQHYTGWGKNLNNLDFQKNNDNLKKQHALDNGIKYYIEVDSRLSDFNYISKNILNTELTEILDLSKVDWIECGRYASSSLLFKTADLYNKGMSVVDIMNTLKISRSTVQVYLRKSEALNLCRWDRLNRIDIILLNTKEIFSSALEAAKAYDIKSPQNIRSVCQGLHKYCGLHPITGEPLVWRNLKDYDESEIIDFKSLYNPCTAKIKDK